MDSQRAIKQVPDTAIGYQSSGDVYRAMGKPQKALEMYQQALKRNQNDADAHYGIGLVYASQQKYVQAVEHYDRVVKLAPKSAIGYQWRGDALAALEKFQAALDDFQRVTKLAEMAPDLAYGYLRSGHIYEAIGKPERALRNVPTGLGVKSPNPR